MSLVVRMLSIFCFLLLLGTLSACSESVNLQSGLGDEDANEIVAVLKRNGIDAKKHTAKDGVALVVKDSDISRASEVLRAAGLPRRAHSSLGQVFKKEGMISTPMEERARYIHGLSEELEGTLQQFDNVIAARVHVVLPERVAPGEPIQPSSAAVFIKYKPPFDQDIGIPQIRNLVAASIPGLAGEEGRSKVSVVLMPTETEDHPIEWVTVGPFGVQAASAGMLAMTLIGLFAYAMLSTLGVLVLLAMRNPKVANWLKPHLDRMPNLQEVLDGKKVAARMRENEVK